ncbi:MAG TPA: hypothetical protein VG754_09980 [Verrucomicrobiae bacterium]|nr:hypothetical protein [Verrucomicrobiae bacterium]
MACKWLKKLEKRALCGDIPRMVTLKADDRSRIKIPGAKPGQVFAFEDQGNGVRILTEVKAEPKEPFPPGSLRKLVDEMNREWAGVKPKVPVPEDRD